MRLHYDGRGSTLFAELTRQPEYYQTRSERAILHDRAPEIAAALGTEPISVIELGAGRAEKIRPLLSALADAGRLDGFWPFDVAEGEVRDVLAELAPAYPDAHLGGIVGDFTRHLAHLPDHHDTRLVAFLGGTFGNFNGMERSQFLRDLREWHALTGQPGWECCLALMQLDDVPASDASQGRSVNAQTLVTTVKIISAHLRPSDKVFRYDASKFLIRLSGTDLERGKMVISRIRETITNGLRSAGGGGATSEVTTSFGIAMLDPEVDALESIDRADQALTLARTAGGNRVITWDPSVTTGMRLRRLEVKNTEG